MAIDLRIYKDKDFDWNNWTDDGDSTNEAVESKIDREILLIKNEQYWMDTNYYNGIDWDYITANKDILHSNVEAGKKGTYLGNIKNNISNALADLPFFVDIKNIDITEKDEKDDNGRSMGKFNQLKVDFTICFDKEKIQEYERNYKI